MEIARSLGLPVGCRFEPPETELLAHYLYIVKLLISLEQIKVMDCWMMEEIVAETEAEHPEEMELPSSSIMLYLPNFKRVCTEAYTLKYPSLAELVYIECNPKLKIKFDLGVLRTVPAENAYVLKERYVVLSTPTLTKKLLGSI